MEFDYAGQVGELGSLYSVIAAGLAILLLAVVRSRRGSLVPSDGQKVRARDICERRLLTIACTIQSGALQLKGNRSIFAPSLIPQCLAMETTLRAVNVSYDFVDSPSSAIPPL